MNPVQAIDILGMVQPCTINHEDLKTAFRRAAQKYHPDKGGSTQMMQAVNAAYDLLQKHIGATIADFANADSAGYADLLNEAINAIIDLNGLVLEVCGLWVWVSGDTYHHRAVLKQAGYSYASKKFMWYFRPEDAARGRGKSSMEDIRGKYGSVKPTRTHYQSIG